MHVYLATLNSRYTHTSLAIHQLASALRRAEIPVTVGEWSINGDIYDHLRGLYESDAELVAFSTYIWNREETLLLAEELKRLKPGVQILLGGPEVSYGASDLLATNPFIDYVIAGEGERAIVQLAGGEPLEWIQGLVYRREDRIIDQGIAPLLNPEDFQTMPYGDLAAYEHRILYYETSRGCPYRCSYCLSSVTDGVRFSPVERVKRDFETFVRAGVKQVKCVDRTFNVRVDRAKEILAHCVAIDRGHTNFHFEMTAHLFDREMMAILASARPGLFQFEIGIQSTHEPTLRAVNRPMPFEQMKPSIEALIGLDRHHVHLDLIAGLPEESYERFLRSLDDVMALHPHMMQLGFLKLIRGSQLRDEATAHGYLAALKPPYQVLRTKWISYVEMGVLSDLEHLIDHFYNSGQFRWTLHRLVSEFFGNRWSRFFLDFRGYLVDVGALDHAMGQAEKYQRLHDFLMLRCGKDARSLGETLAYDAQVSGYRGITHLLDRSEPEDYQAKCYRFLNNAENREHYLPHLVDTSDKKAMKQVVFAHFEDPPVPGEDATDYLIDRSQTDYLGRHPAHPIVL